MKILILAAGYATRLYPLTKHWPKPLLMVKEKPIISHIVEKVDNIEWCDEIIVVTNNKFFHNFEEWAANSGFKTRISVINDKTVSADDRLGAIGDINFVVNALNIQDDLMVIGGDNLFSFDLEKFAESVKDKNAQCAVGVYDIEDPAMVSHYGVVTLDQQDRIIDFKEKPEQSESTLISMCVYFFAKESLNLFKEYVRQRDCHDTSGDYIKWLCKKSDVFGYKFCGIWYDIGDIVTFYHASLTYEG